MPWQSVPMVTVRGFSSMYNHQWFDISSHCNILTAWTGVQLPQDLEYACFGCVCVIPACVPAVCDYACTCILVEYVSDCR